MKKYFLLTLLAAGCTAALYTGCTTNIKPMEPIRRVAVWVPDNPASQPSSAPTTTYAVGEPIPELAPLLATTEPFPTTPTTPPTTHPATRPSKHSTTRPAATQSASTESAATEAASTEAASTESAATEPATTASASSQLTTQPTTRPSHRGEHLVVRVIDPNETSRYIYHASYDNVWQQSMKLLNDTGFLLDRKDYRLGILTTQPLASAQWVEFWKPQQTTFKNAMENTVNMQQRTVRISISKVPEKPDFYEIAIQVLVERQNNPIEMIGGPVFVEGSGFGASQVSLRSDYSPAITKDVYPNWYVIGHDQQLEHKLLTELFRHI